jgi:serine/threonine-protein kinase
VSSNGPDLTGQRIGEYEISARVGVGGMGAVYEGKQPLIGKRVAVKVLLPTLSNERELVERFLSEARAVNEIRHRGIVDIFSFGQLPDGSHYFVMEFLEGQAFDKIIKRRAPLPLGEALQWTEEVLDALDAAHSAGIIHRDIKPSNIFLVDTGRGRPYVKLLDFGIAKLGAIQGEATPQTRASVILGTPDYISPEQARGKPISPQTDIYAIGCVLFEMLTGQRVFRGENTLQTMWMHVEDPPPDPCNLRPDLPRELGDLVLYCLEKDAANRPPSAGYLRDQLARVRQQYTPTGQFSPPLTGSLAQGIAQTPPPSGRNRVLQGTPAPSRASGHLRTPSPASRSGGQRSLSGQRPRLGETPAELDATSPSQRAVQLSEERPPETRLAPLTAVTASSEPGQSTRLSRPPTPLPVPRQQADGPAHVAADEEPLPPPPRSKLPFVLAGVAGTLVFGLVAFLVLREPTPAPEPLHVEVLRPTAEPPRPPEAPKPVAEVPPEAPKPPEEGKPVAVEPKPPPEEPKPVAVVTPPTESPKPTETRPKGRGITAEQLASRLRKIEATLAAREAEKGEPDKVLRQFIDQVKKDIARATSDADRKEAWSTLNDIEAQLRR